MEKLLKNPLFVLSMLAALLMSPSVWAKCSVMNSDLGKIATRSEVSKRTASTSNIQPCGGNALADLPIWLYTGPSKLEMVKLKAGESLDRYESRAKGANHPDNLEQVVFGGGLQIQTLSASGRFDPVAGLLLGGTLMPHEPLVIPLGAYRWSESNKITLTYGKRNLVITPRNGIIKIDFKGEKVAGFRLKQGQLEANFDYAYEGLEPEFLAAYQALKQREGGEDHPFIRAQLAALFWEWNMSNNAVSVAYEDQ